MVTPSAGGPGGSIVVTTSGQGSITTQGVESHGIWATSTTGTVQVNATNVSTTGQFSTGINARRRLVARRSTSRQARR